MTEWIIPCNIKYYDVTGAFKKLKKLDWKQSNKNIETGDIVYIYIGNPVAEIRYKCKVNKVNLPEVEIDDFEFRVNGEVYENYGNHMELELLKEYDGTITIDQLKEHGLKGNIQGPRRAAEEISEFISSVE